MEKLFCCFVSMSCCFGAPGGGGGAQSCFPPCRLTSPWPDLSPLLIRIPSPLSRLITVLLAGLSQSDSTAFAVCRVRPLPFCFSFESLWTGLLFYSFLSTLTIDSSPARPLPLVDFSTLRYLSFFSSRIASDFCLIFVPTRPSCLR